MPNSGETQELYGLHTKAQRSKRAQFSIHTMTAAGAVTTLISTRAGFSRS